MLRLLVGSARQSLERGSSQFVPICVDRLAAISWWSKIALWRDLRQIEARFD
jgi:hypothetical protein